METSEYDPVPTAVRVIFGLLVSVGLGFLTLAALFTGAIAYTGCFISCSDPDRLGGGLILAGSVLAAAATVVACVWAVAGRRSWLRYVFFGALPVLGLALLALMSYW